LFERPNIQLCSTGRQLSALIINLN
jgi:hypothetical protein